MKKAIMSVVFGVVAAGGANGQALAAFEVPPEFLASEILPQELLAGPRFRVRESAPSDGYLTHFTIDSDFGVFQCAGRRQLEQRIAEIDALEKLSAISKSDLFAEGLRRSVTAPIDAVKNIMDDPGKTAKQLPKTVGHFFQKVGSSIGNTAKKIDSKIRDEEEADLAGTGRGIGNAAKSVAGFDKAKLDTARQLGVDPYSDNARLQEEMEKVTWAFFAGGLPLRVGAMVASGGASTALVVTKAAGLPEDIYDVTPGELALRDRTDLEGMNVPGGIVDSIFLNPVLSISLRHAIVRAMKSLPGGDEMMASIARSAAECTTVSQAAFFTDSLRLLAARNVKLPYTGLVMIGRLPAGKTADGGLEVFTPVDYVSWTEEVAAFAGKGEAGGKRTLLGLAGLSPAARKGFEVTGWQVALP